MRGVEGVLGILSTLPNFTEGEGSGGFFFHLKRMQSGDLRSLVCVCVRVCFVLRGGEKKKREREKGEKKKRVF